MAKVNMRRLSLLVLAMLVVSVYVQAQQRSDSVTVVFRQGKSVLELSLGNNRSELDRMAGSMVDALSGGLGLKRVLVVSGASPEGGVKRNKKLSAERAESMLKYLLKTAAIPDTIKTVVLIGRDWKGLVRMAKADKKLPYHDETVALLEQIADGKIAEKDHLKRLESLRGGKPYKYMYEKYFPGLRAANLYVWYEDRNAMKESSTTADQMANNAAGQDTVITVTAAQTDDVATGETKERKPFYASLKTNMLYDVLLVPNIGAEFYLGKGWSVAANGMYAWWSNNDKHRYWRIYGGEIAVRKWFGKAAAEKPLTGHHIGVYGQVLTFDIELGGKGYMGGKPGGSMMDKLHWYAGVEYGYSLPIARRLNIDFTLGVGYGGGTYYEYKPIDDHYVWQATKERKWFGPTKAEISLVWLIGNGNVNKKKGGDK